MIAQNTLARVNPQSTVISTLKHIVLTVKAAADVKPAKTLSQYSGTCHTDQITPRMRLAASGEYRFSILGWRNPRHPASSPRGPVVMARRTPGAKYWPSPAGSILPIPPWVAP